MGRNVVFRPTFGPRGSGRAVRAEPKMAAWAESAAGRGVRAVTGSGLGDMGAPSAYVAVRAVTGSGLGDMGAPRGR